MRNGLIRDIFRHLDADGSLRVGACARQISDRIEALPIPLDVKRLLQSTWTNTGGQVGPYSIYPPEAVLQSEDMSRYLEAGMLQVGHALNGDPVVLRFDSDKCAVGLVSHDQLWEEEVPGPADAYVQVTESVDEYLWRAAERLYLPIDYYAARELVELKRSIERTNPRDPPVQPTGFASG